MPDETPGLPPAAPSSSITRPLRHRAVVIVAAVLLVAAMAAQLATSREELAQITRLSWPVLAGVLLLQVAAQLAWNGAMLVPLRRHMQDLGYWELSMVRAGGFLVGSIIPVAGNIGVRLAYLRRRGLSYAHFTWATLFTNTVALLAVGSVAVLAAALLRRWHGPLPPAVVLLTAAVFVLGAAAVAAFHLLPRFVGHAWIARRVKRLELGSLHATPWMFIRVFLFALARHAGNFLSFGVLYQALSSSPGGLVAGGLVYAMTSPIRVVQIVPGNIGVNEWTVALAGGILSYDLTTGLLVAVVFRGMTLVAQAVAALPGSWIAIRGQS